jgi:hypothetical protein
VLQDVFESVFKFLYESQRVLKDRVSVETAFEPFSEKGSRIINNGIIDVGIDKGKPLFESE